MKNKSDLYFKIVLAILFLLCLLKMPYGYYQFIRISGFISFLYLAYQSKAKPFFVVIWIFSAILINPFLKIYFTKFTWNIIDVIWAMLLILSNFYKHHTLKK